MPYTYIFLFEGSLFRLSPNCLCCLQEFFLVDFIKNQVSAVKEHDDWANFKSKCALIVLN